jgi:hypothetical protein
MRNSLKGLFLLFLFGGLTLLFRPASALAATGPNVTTSPVSVTLSTPPGTTTSTKLALRNNGDAPIGMTLQLDTFSADGSSGQARIQTPPANDASISWVHFSQTSFTTQPNAWSYIQMTINVPKTASLGYYYAVLFRPSISVSLNGANTNVINGYNAILVLLNAVTPNEHPQLQLAGFSTTRKINEYLPVTFSINIRNHGNIYLPPSGDVYISRTSSFSKIIDVMSINPGVGNILPGTNRIFSVKWVNGDPVFTPKELDGQPVNTKQGQPIYELKWSLAHIHKFRFGEYYARLVMVYNNGVHDVAVTSVLSFWVIPWKLILAFVILVVILGIGLKLLKKRYSLVKRTKKNS